MLHSSSEMHTMGGMCMASLFCMRNNTCFSGAGTRC